MRLLAGETVNLVFDRRVMARPDTFDDAGVHRTAFQACADDVVRTLCAYVGVRTSIGVRATIGDVIQHGICAGCIAALRITENIGTGSRSPDCSCITDKSMLRPAIASTSLSRYPLPMPPMDGLQDICPRVSILCLNNRVFWPMRAKARATSVAE